MVRSNCTSTSCTIAVNGNAAPSPLHHKVNVGVYYGAYALLEHLGFSFLHPLVQVVPSSVQFSAKHPPIALESRPRWPIRGEHYHSMHPLEFTELFNGFDSMYDNGTVQAWDTMVPEFSQYCEWLIANGQNRLEWVLLYAEEWSEFAWSETRRERLESLIHIAHQWGISVGADVPIALVQQHSWCLSCGMPPNASSVHHTIYDVFQTHIDWIMDAGFDFLSSESGTTEFTNPGCKEMLNWMNAVNDYVESKHGKRMYIKCHCSRGQTCPGFASPLFPGKDIDFNFLPFYANSTLGIYPHTVQIYNFTQPAPTYGNTNFSYMLDFLVLEMGKRDVVYQGETAYWVNYDIDVPLFLPIYGYNRVSDLRAIARKESSSKKMKGQMNFQSGWTWGYWLNDVMALRAAWNPQIEMSENDAIRHFLSPLERAFGEAVGPKVVDAMIELIEVQKELLVYGKYSPTLEVESVVKRNGIAYIEGWDTWAQLEALLSQVGGSSDLSTQPIRMSIEGVRDPLAKPSYTKEVKPLLQAMKSRLQSICDELDQVDDHGEIPNEEAKKLFHQIHASMSMTCLRSTQVLALYNYASTWLTPHNVSMREEQLSIAHDAILKATSIVREQESNYAVPLQRIAFWGRPQPTAYNYGYVWTVHSLYYMWRDYGRVLDKSAESILSPCYLNIINPLNVAIGDGLWQNITDELYKLFDKVKYVDFVADCLEGPKKEPVFPKDLYPHQ